MENLIKKWQAEFDLLEKRFYKEVYNEKTLANANTLKGEIFRLASCLKDLKALAKSLKKYGK
jgi:hypothetical protein